MKKVIMILTGFALAFTMNVNAQTMVADGEVDSVTIGSLMQYEVTPDATIAGMANMYNSHFEWVISGSNTPEEADSASTGLYTQSTITVRWAGSAGDNPTVSVAENSRPYFGTGCADATPETQSVLLLAKPTAAWNGATTGGGCNVTTYDIDVDVSGVGPWIIDYTVSKDGGAAAPKTSAAIGSASDKGSNTITLPLDASHFSGVGVYTVNITAISDRISRKSIDAADLSGSLPGTAYTIGINPTPNTGTIRHIQNL